MYAYSGVYFVSQALAVVVVVVGRGGTTEAYMVIILYTACHYCKGMRFLSYEVSISEDDPAISEDS